MEPYQRPPKDKDELLAWIELEWNKLQAAIAALDEGQMSVPDAGGWTIKDNLAHLAEWERFLCLNHLQGMPAHEAMGIDPETFASLDEDGINAILAERSRGSSAAEILRKLEASHAQVLQELENWSYEDLMKPRFDNGDPSRTVGLYVAGNTYLHYREHREVIENNLG